MESASAGPSATCAEATGMREIESLSARRYDKSSAEVDLIFISVMAFGMVRVAL